MMTISQHAKKPVNGTSISTTTVRVHTLSTFKQPFDAEGQPVELGRPLIQERIARNETRQAEDP
jgi:hypothetical protein